MAKRKWYVVVVGTSVGVFSNWLEVSPLITGVSGARHQSFATREEALEAFSVECAKGRVKVVDASSSGSSSIASTHSSSRTMTPRRRPQSFSSVSRTPQSPSINIQRRHDNHFSPAVTVQTPSGLSYYPSNRSTPRTTSMSTVTGRLSPLDLRSPTIERTRPDIDVNMTPSRRSHVSARSFRSPEGQLQVSISFPVPECVNCSRNATDPCEDALSNAFSQMHVKKKMVYDKQLDPRSPTPGVSYVPLSTNNTISFGRQSPSRTPRNDSALFRRHH